MGPIDQHVDPSYTSDVFPAAAADEPAPQVGERGAGPISEAVTGGQSDLSGIVAETPRHNPFDQDQRVDHAGDPAYARDPVCGIWVEKQGAANTLASPVNAQMGTVYFCSPECKALFEEDPARYGSGF